MSCSTTSSSLFNPITYRYVRRSGSLCADGVNVVKDYAMPAQQRLTLYANAIPELAGQDFSTTVVATVPAWSPSA